MAVRSGAKFLGNGHRIMFCGALQNCVSGNLIVLNHGIPAEMLALGRDKSTQAHFVALLQNHKEEFYFPFICGSVEQEVIQDK